MKIKKFVLERFGHFTDQGFDFDGGKGFHVLYGPNEAGKSTVLHGLRDALFGIDTRSPYNFVHDYGDMRLLAEVENAAGETIAFRRRKGNKNTLLDLKDAVLPDTALAAFLGPIDRGFFTRMFGLDHTELRRGGKSLLDSGGDAADSLFGAASGLSSVLSISGDLKESADALFTARRSQAKPFYQALDRRQEAQRELRESTVTTAEWKNLQEETKHVMEKRERLAEEIKEQRAEETRANRSLRVRPHVNKIRELRQKIAELGDVPGLASDSIKRREEAMETRKNTSSDLSRLETDIKRLASRIDGLDISDDLLGHKDAIETLFEERGRIIAGRKDAPKLETSIKQELTTISGLLRSLGVDLDASKAKTALPTEGLVTNIRNLVSEAAEKRTQEKNKKEAVQETKQAIKTTGKSISALPGAQDDSALRKVLRAVQRKGDQKNRLRAAEKEVERLAEQLEKANAALPLWDGVPDKLVALKVPVSETVSIFEEDLGELGKSLGSLNERIEATKTEISGLEENIQSLLSTREVPTEDAVRSARNHRDEGWRLIRGRYLDEDKKITDKKIKSFAADTPIADFYEGAVQEADSLVDRKEAEAQRVATLEELTRRKEEAAVLLEKSRGQKDGIEGQQAEKREAWSKAWKPTGITPLSPREMAGWLVQRDQINVLFQHWKSADSEQQFSKSAYEEAQNGLRQALSTLEGKDKDRSADDLETVTSDAEDLLEDLEETKAERKRLATQLNESNTNLARLQLEFDDATAALGSWQAEWKDAMKELGQKETQRPQDIGSVLDLYDDLETAITNKARLQDRLDGIHRDETSFQEQVADLVTSLAPDIKQDDPVSACQLLFNRLQKMIAAQDQLKRLQADKAKLEKQKEEKSDTIADMERILGQLMGEAGCDNDEDLIANHNRWKQHQGLEQALQEKFDAMDEAGDGLSFDALAEEVDASTPDENHATIDASEALLKSIQESFTEIGSRIRELEQKRTEIELGRGADRCAQAIEQSLADLRDNSQAYIIQKAAHLLLQVAVEKVRQERQGPIVDSAGSLFSDLTMGSFSGLVIDFDEDDRPVLKGVRPNDNRVDVDGMSEGARDQLFLALRLALVKQYLEEAEPLPFVADDLLVSFDNDRAGAALNVLKNLSETTQVLFFTHHEHLVDLAKEHLGDDGFSLHAFD